MIFFFAYVSSSSPVVKLKDGLINSATTETPTQSASFTSSATPTRAASAGPTACTDTPSSIPLLLKFWDYADADTLSDHDQSYENPGRMPYEDTQERLPHTSELRSDDFFTLHRMTTPRQPSPPGLHRRLQMLIDRDPTPPLEALVRFHASFPAHEQSARTYNILLRLAIRNASYHTVAHLLEEMGELDVPGNEHTLKYTVRSLVRQGRWSDAFELATSGYQGMTNHGLNGVSPIVWGELFGGTQRGAIRRGFGEHGSRPVTPQTHGISPGQLLLAMRQLPQLRFTLRSVNRPSKPTLYHFVQALLRMGERRAAFDITLRLLRAEPTVWGIRFVHLHIALLGRRPMPKPGLQRYNAAYRDLDVILSECPSLRPDATTLFILLGHLKGTVNCGTLGHRLLLQFQARWGQHVVDGKVRARMLVLARKQGQPALVRRCVAAIRSSGDLKGTRGDVSQGSTRTARPRGSMYLRRGAERSRSWKLVRSVRKHGASPPEPSL